MYHGAHVRSEEDLALIILFHHVDPWAWIQAVRLGDKHLYLLSYLTDYGFSLTVN